MASDAPGLLLVQIDALGYHHLQQAMAAGHLPYLQTLLEADRVRLQRWRCGLPSDTPSAQCGLMYGYHHDVVGFYWLDRAADRWVNCANPWHVAEIERRVALAGKPGLLEGGHAYVTVISGGARRAVCSTSRVAPDGLNLAALLAIVRRPQALAAGLAAGVGDTLAEIGHYARGGYRQASVPKELLFLVARLVLNVALRQVAVTGALEDLRRGVPVIFVGLSGYDLVAHFYGPNSANAFGTLGGIDGAVARLHRASLAGPHRYRMIVFSDHGMTPAVPFARLYGRPLARLMLDLVPGEGVETTVEPRKQPSQDTWLGRLIDGLSSWMSQASVLTPRETLKSRQLAVVATSPVAHVYLKGTRRRLDLSEVAARHPALIDAVAGHEGIGAVVGREGDAIVVIGKAGRLLIGPNGSVVAGRHPLGDLEEPAIMAGQLRRYALMPSVGDLIVFGARRGDAVVCFEDQAGTHGGLGGEQSFPFLIHPAEDDLDLEHVRSATDLYPILSQLRSPHALGVVDPVSRGRQGTGD
ncbi:MAG: alkaline phosphatase family protein [Chloroflexi bacterium]|nr:alkaline phosphatase family protein [Chloroflexota bacterium]